MAVRDGEAGLAPEVPAVLRLLAAGGAERILLETAGVGQGDVSVLELADLGVAVTAPGLGDAVQAAKAGLFEVADFVVVNQADRSGAEAMAAAFRALRSGPVLLTSAVEGTGVEELRTALEADLAARAPLDRPGSSGDDEPNPEEAGPEEASPEVRLHHVGIAVRDGGEAAELWRTLLGLREEGRYPVEEFGVLALFLAPDRGPTPAAGAVCWNSSSPWLRTARSPVSCPGGAKGSITSASRSRTSTGRWPLSKHGAFAWWTGSRAAAPEVIWWPSSTRRVRGVYCWS